MTNENIPVTTKQYQYHVQQWMDILDQGDNLSILFFRMTDRLRRIQQFVNEYNMTHKLTNKDARYIFLVLDSLVNNHNVEDREDLQDHITVQLNYKYAITPKKVFADWINHFKENQQRLVLIIPQAEELHNTLDHNVMPWLQYLVQQYDPYVSIMSFYETDITSPENVAILSDISALEQKILHYPLYSLTDSAHFIHYLEKKWSMEVSERQLEEILRLCGGHFWFIKEAVREIRDRQVWSSDLEDMQFRLRTLCQLLLPSEQTTLRKVITKADVFSDIEKHALQYFQKMQFVDELDNCRLQLLEKYFLKQHLDKNQFLVKNEQIQYNNVPLAGFFSRQEYRVFRALLEQKDTVLSRDQIAQIIWPENTQDNYSDWAIDQLIARIRRRLQQLSISPEVVKAVRGKGYKFDIE